MKFLRTNLVAAVVSLLVITGYAHDLFDGCDDHARAEQALGSQVSNHTPNDFAQHNGDDCRCLCHQLFSNLVTEPIRVGSASHVTGFGFDGRSEFPPDAEPRGIDHPPQLA